MRRVYLGVIPEVGIGGYSPNGHLVFVYLDSRLPTLKRIIQEQLKRTLAHELHHCIRWRNPGYGKILLEALVSEGLADHFDMEVTGEGPSLWCTALSSDQIQTYLERAKVEYNSPTYNHRAWFFGRGDTDIPRWTGYSLGLYLVQEYFKKHSDKKPSQLYTVKAVEFV